MQELIININIMHTFTMFNLQWFFFSAILGGILQSPFYGHNSLAAVNYGSLGMIIGHEMTHGFDSIG